MSLMMLKKHFGGRINVVMERHKFFMRVQAKDERVGNYIASLKTLAQTCDFAELTDSLIRDQLVRCTNNPRVQEKLLAKNSTLQEAQLIAESMEHAILWAKEMKGASHGIHAESALPGSSCDCVQECDFGQKVSSKGKINNGTVEKSNVRCYKCGNVGHLANNPKCFARNVNCRNCGKRGHLAKVCKSSKVNMVSESTSAQQMILHVDYTNQQCSENKLVMPRCDIGIDGKTVPVLADSGSPFTLIGDKNWERIFAGEKIELVPPDIDPIGYGGQKIDLIGYSVMTIEFKGRETVGKVYVAKRGNNLLGWRHQRDLGIVLNPNTPDQILSVSVLGDDEEIVSNFPEVFNDGLGLLKNFKHKIILKSNASPAVFKREAFGAAIVITLAIECTEDSREDGWGSRERRHRSHWEEIAVYAVLGGCNKKDVK
ncbi:hypothetical protein NDU88_005687 [Pleurodeles waltl]|uniref:CCHC-type domain-containing protein n=1 Tax=Pleurodeles waltl TaxID=8319 RepID=A0AAV7SMC0_PLEWA|nr:hypothetical protein NDU88_005687 [Pleurodeles waltl]